MNRQRAFTLIELLVVLSILVVLIALLLPSLSKARKAARTAVCLTNQHALAQAMHLYFAEANIAHLGSRLSPAFDHNDFRAVGENMFDHLFLAHNVPSNQWFAVDYHSNADKIRWCPETPDAASPSYPIDGAAHRRWDVGHTGSYGFNSWLYQNPRPRLMMSGGVVAGDRWGDGVPYYYNLGPATRNPSAVPAFVDCESADLWVPMPTDPVPSDLENPYPGAYPGLRFACINRHSMAVNVTFADGHGETVKLGNLWTLKWHATWDRTTPAQVPAK
jgi:prepilin-type N-terminal cleavage/methylation domain-containing protein/prepilin-type processing-associated H-X9-DG protein